MSSVFLPTVGESNASVVVKFGGTSVATSSGWIQIAEVARRRRLNERLWIVVSALAGVTDRLERALADATSGGGSMAATEIACQHIDLAREIGVEESRLGPVLELTEQIARWLEGIRLTGEVTPRLIAKVLASGELASSRLGAAILEREGIPVSWVDARELLIADPAEGEPAETRYLSARVSPRTDPEHAGRVAGDASVVLTQGFIAGNEAGETCLLGRGGSDTSAALIASLVGAERLEIWTDVPGMFTTDPHDNPAARLIRRIGYRDAQELAAMGAKVLHPRCLAPARAFDVPIEIKSTRHPHLEGTRIQRDDETGPAVSAVTVRRGITLVTIATLAMWETPGFLARTFAPFDECQISIDLVATSQSAVSVTLDRIPGGLEGEPFGRLLSRLRQLGSVRVVPCCAVVSIVGRRIRMVLHELGPALEVFRERPVHLVSDSSEDLNLSFVVDESEASGLASRLHERLFPAQGGHPRLGPTWEKLLESGPVTPHRERWWRSARDRLLALSGDGRPRYVYHLPTVRSRARALRNAIGSVDRFYYSMKANPHPRILETLTAEGFGIECVSAAEVTRARELLGRDTPLLFTPNFCPIEEYAVALEAGAEVTIDGAHLFDQAPALFSGVDVAVRVDPGHGLGHHPKVRTAGGDAKFGLTTDEICSLADAARAAGVRIVGLHAHVGSGVLTPAAWAITGRALAALMEHVAELAWIDLGGGLGVAERPGQGELDLAAIEASLAPLRSEIGRVELRLEPGRYLVSDAGVLLARVTQVRRKGGVNLVGLATGMNSLIRPALYGAWHGIENLSRLDQRASDYWHVVGPICESSDVLGRDRWMPEPSPGDVMLIDHAGAYGSVMSSRYNLREPAIEEVIES